jgi:hypothetical protein
MDQATESEAAAKVAQALAVAVQIAETVVRLRSQKAAGREAGARQLEGAARAERTAHYAADRVTWSLTNEPRWCCPATWPRARDSTAFTRRPRGDAGPGVGGQRRVHMAKKGDPRRRSIAAAICQAGV